MSATVSRLDVGTSHREDLRAVDCPNDLPASRFDAAVHQQPEEIDALFAPGIAFVPADDRRREAAHIVRKPAACASRPSWTILGGALAAGRPMLNDPADVLPVQAG